MLNIANKSKELGDGLICRWEEFWVIHQPYLLQTGYLLPERYNPKWIPSWYGTNKERRDCPDAHAMKVSKSQDQIATCVFSAFPTVSISTY